MKVEDNRTLHAPKYASLVSDTPQTDLSRWIVRSLPAEDEKFIALAPGRLDVLGGIAEYTGALVLSVPLAEHACVGMQRRTDGLLSLRMHPTEKENQGVAYDIPLSQFRNSDGSLIAGADGKGLFAPQNNFLACAAGTIIEAMRIGAFAKLSGGLTLAIASDPGAIPGNCFSAVSSATLVCAAALAQEIIEPNIAALVSQTVDNDWLGVASGPSGALCGLLGEANSVTQFRCDNRTLGGVIHLPDGYRIVAIDCGTVDPGHQEKFYQVRTATFMGRLLIDRIVRHDGLLSGQWDGHLSRISVNDFVEQLRDRLPTRMLGRDFLNRFGETGDRLTRIDPDHTYKVRSRTEHHVYEHARSRQFVEAVSRGIRTGDRSAFADAGGAMNASHWSCGQRCGMGSVPANSLVNDLRKAGPAAGIFGARIAGRGCGSMVAVLADDSDSAGRTLEGSLNAFRRDYNTQARMLTGSLAGAMVSGAVRV